MRRLLAMMSVGLAVTLAVAGCGADDDEQQPAAVGGDTRSFNEESDARYTEDQVVEMAGFTDDGTGGLAGPNDCQISVVMTTRDLVELYAGAGDAVVTNQAGDVGVKFFPDPGCREALLAALAKVP